MGDLHEVSAQNGLANVRVVIPRREIRAHERKVEALANAHELRAHVVRALHRAMADVIVPAPIRIIFGLLVRVINVEQGQVIAVDVSELSLRRVRLLGLIPRANETHGHGEHGDDGEHLVRALELARRDEHFRQLWIQRVLRHHLTDRGQVTVVV